MASVAVHHINEKFHQHLHCPRVGISDSTVIAIQWNHCQSTLFLERDYKKGCTRLEVVERRKLRTDTTEIQDNQLIATKRRPLFFESEINRANRAADKISQQSLVVMHCMRELRFDFLNVG